LAGTGLGKRPRGDWREAGKLYSSSSSVPRPWNYSKRFLDGRQKRGEKKPWVVFPPKSTIVSARKMLFGHWDTVSERDAALC